MTKQQPFAAKLRLSNICRWLITLCTLKLCLLGALTFDIEFPSLQKFSFTGGTAEKAGTHSTLGASDAQLSAEQGGNTAAPALKTPDAAPQDATLQGLASLGMDTPLPQGAAAARAAAQLTPSKWQKESPAGLVASANLAAPSVAPLPTLTVANPHSEPQGFTAALPSPKAVQPTEDKDTAWWNNILQLNSLPFPRWSVQRAAYAATLDTPPPPTMRNDTGDSPFLPPAQAIARDAQAVAPAPQAQSRDAAPRALPAGTAGPKMLGTANTPNMLVPNRRPPTPKVDAYTPPEDPNRRQQELARREQEVLMLKQQMEQRLNELNNAEKKMQSMLREAKDVEDNKLKNLVGMYINMKPKRAAKAIESLDERVAVKILSKMSPKQCGDILSYTNPEVTARLTELISRMRMER